MENLKIESRYVKLCNEFNAVVRCRPDYLKPLMWASICFKTCGWASETLPELFKHLAELLRIYDKTKCSAENLNSSATYLCNNGHALYVHHPLKLTSHSVLHFLRSADLSKSFFQSIVSIFLLFSINRFCQYSSFLNIFFIQ